MDSAALRYLSWRISTRLLSALFFSMLIQLMHFAEVQSGLLLHSGNLIRGGGSQAVLLVTTKYEQRLLEFDLFFEELLKAFCGTFVKQVLYMQGVQMCWAVWALYPFYKGQNNPTNIWLLSSMERTQSLSFHGQMTLRGCSHLVLPSVLSELITSGQLQAWQFTPGVERVSTCVSSDLLSSAPYANLHIHYWNKWTHFLTQRKKSSCRARTLAELTRRHKQLRMCCWQHFTKFIKLLLT